MNEYTVRSTYTHAESAARRAADIAVILIFCALLVFVLFRFVLTPAVAESPAVNGFSEGEVLLVDRVSGFVIDYSVGDVVRAKIGGEYKLLRVAAKGGSTYLVRNGKAYLDGALIDESEYGGVWKRGADMETTVPEESLLLLPDDRAGVASLEEQILQYDAVFGEVRFRVSPIKRAAFFY